VLRGSQGWTNLASGYVNGRDDVGGVSIEATDAAGYGRADHVLADVDVDEGVGRGLEDAGDDLGGEDGFADDALTPALDPVDGRGLLVRAEVPAQREYLHVRELALDRVQRLLRALGEHVHAHGVAGLRDEAYEQVAARDPHVYLRQPGEATRLVEAALHPLEVLRLLHPRHRLARPHYVREAHHRAPRHTCRPQAISLTSKTKTKASNIKPCVSNVLKCRATRYSPLCARHCLLPPPPPRNLAGPGCPRARSPPHRALFLSLSLSLSLSLARTRARTHTRTHAHAHAHIRTERRRYRTVRRRPLSRLMLYIDNRYWILPIRRFHGERAHSKSISEGK
jgi:hypothetical protein